MGSEEEWAGEGGERLWEVRGTVRVKVDHCRVTQKTFDNIQYHK